MMVINFYSPKGGVGTTTIASLLALDYSKHHYIGLVAKDTNANCAVLGFGDLEVPYKINHGLTLSNEPVPDCDFIFVDSRAHMPAADINILITQTTYACLRKTMDCKADMAIVNVIDDAPINLRDAGAILGEVGPIQEVKWDHETLRKLDAGLARRVLEREDWKRLVLALDNHIKQDVPF
jgi:hypothetical protein